MINKKRLIRLFLDLVKVKSVSKDEKKASEHIKKYFIKYGIRFVSDGAGKKIGGNCGNFYATLKGNRKDAPKILLNAHIDTVVHEGRISPSISKGIIQTDGKTILGADCKAGVAAIMEVVSTFKEKKISHGDIVLCFTVAEEIGLVGAKQADSKLLKADMGFVIDGGDVHKIITKAPSQLSFDATVIGRPSHAGVRPEDGINAIKVASVAIAKMKLGRIDKESTANIGIIEGGIATNIVPEKVTIKGEARSHNKEKLNRQVQHMSKAVKDACAKSKALFKIDISPVYQSFNIKNDSLVVKTVLKASKGIGLKPEIAMTGGGSDANIFNKMGVPCVILGVGAHKPHTAQEYIAVDDLIKGAELILEIVKTAAGI